MSPEDRRLAALLAAFVPERAGDLAAHLDGPRAARVRSAAEALVRAGRSARLAELASVLAAPDGASMSATDTGARAETGGERLRERFRLELRCAQSRR